VRGHSVSLRLKRGLFLLVFAALVAGIFFAVKAAIIQKKPQASELGHPGIGKVPGKGTGPVEEEDRNKDGKTDIWRYFEEGKLTRSEVDRDLNGKADFWAYYKDGKTERQEIDTNSDGKPDGFAYFEQGVKVRQEIDSNYDGRADGRFYYKMGKLCGRAVDSDFDGKIDKVFGEIPDSKGGR